MKNVSESLIFSAADKLSNSTSHYLKVNSTATLLGFETKFCLTNSLLLSYVNFFLLIFSVEQTCESIEWNLNFTFQEGAVVLKG